MNTSSRKLRQFGAPVLIMLLAATLGWFVQAIGVVAVVFIVVLVKRFGKFEAQLAASTFTVVSALFALARHSQFKVGGGLLETAVCVACVWITIAIASERDSAEEAIRRSETYLAEAQRLTHTGSFIWDASTREAVHLSDEWYRLYELDPEKGVPSWEQRLQRLHPEDRTRWQAAIERAIREKSDYELDTRLLLPSGTIKHLHTIGQL